MSTLARLSLAEYDRIVESGAFDGRRLELIHGELRDMSPIGPGHEELVDRLNRWSMPFAIAEKIRVRIQQSVGLLALESVPEPDIASVRPRSYRTGRPTPRDVLLIIEVADSGLAYDLGEKADLYARAGIKEYWVVSVNDGWIEVCRNPKRGRYTSRERFGVEATISPLAFPEAALSVASLFAD